MTAVLLKNASCDRMEIGWREHVSLPDLGIVALKAKIDTGARTSALHAENIEVDQNEEAQWVRFQVPIPGEPQMRSVRARIVDHRLIKNTSGVPEYRYVVATTLVIGRRHWHIEISLADRQQMGFDLILGRTAIRRRRIVVNPGRSYLAGPPSTLHARKSEARVADRGNVAGHDRPPVSIFLTKGDDQ